MQSLRREFLSCQKSSVLEGKVVNLSEMLQKAVEVVFFKKNCISAAEPEPQGAASFWWRRSRRSNEMGLRLRRLRHQT
jgi:hypothetical protein